MSPGFRSTEFWHSVACGALGLALGVAGLWLGHDLTYAGTALLGLSTLAYSHSRGKAKGRPFLPPQGKL